MGKKKTLSRLSQLQPRHWRDRILEELKTFKVVETLRGKMMRGKSGQVGKGSVRSWRALYAILKMFNFPFP